MVNQTKNSTTKNSTGDRTAKVLQHPASAHARARGREAAVDLTQYALADLFAAIFRHPDLDEELGRDLHEAILDHTDVSTVSVEYLRLALR